MADRAEAQVRVEFIAPCVSKLHGSCDGWYLLAVADDISFVRCACVCHDAPGLPA